MEFNINDPQYHMGHLFVDCMRRYPGRICQIDAATGDEETNESVLKRSIKLAIYLRTLGLKPGDVLALGGKNHLDLHIPYYAAMMNGLPITGVDPLFKLHEIKLFFEITQPKIAFCQQNQRENYMQVADELGLDMKVITFDGSESMSEIINQYSDEDTTDFQPAIFDLDKIYFWLVSTGGTTGVLKVAAFKHKVWISKMYNYTFPLFKSKDVSKTTIALNLSPVQWVSSLYNAMGMPLLNQTKLQTSAPINVEHFVDIINKFKPHTVFTGPSIAMNLAYYENCDLTCFDSFIIGGAKVYKDVVQTLRRRTRPDAMVVEVYGQTENLGPIFAPSPMAPLGNCGKRYESIKVKLVDPTTGLEVTEPHVHGELWTKGDDFTEYYNNPTETAKVFSEDGWYKTGDIMYRDEDDYFYYVERMNMLIKYRRYHIIPPELEEIIRTHPGVVNVAVTAIESKEDGEHPVACVVRRMGATVTAQEIKDLIAHKLSDSKRLRGGVIFMDELPLTSIGKVARMKLRQMVQHLPRE